MKRTILTLVAVGLVLALAAGCAAAAPQRSATSGVAADSALGNRAATGPLPAQPAPAIAPGAAVKSAAGSGSGPIAVSETTIAADATRMIIKNASVSLVVSDATVAMSSVNTLATNLGGYISDSNSWHDNDQVRGTVTLRIPADKLNQALDSLHGLAVRVDTESVTGQDVTEQFTDLNAQLINLQATETELRALLTTVREKSNNAQDILAVYQQLSNVRGQIDQVQGRMQYLNNQTAMATIKVDLVPDALAQPVATPGWRPAETLKNAGRSLVNALRGVADAGIYLVVLVLPILIVLAIPIVVLVLLIRWLSHRSRRGSSRPATPAAPAAPAA